MQGIDYPKAGTYVVAVSGGVDSVVLLDMLAKRSNLTLIVVHIDHGIRDDSAKNAQFVQQLTDTYKLPFYKTTLKLGERAGEDQARQKRYQFLETIQQRVNARAVITAHHADDVVETMVINIVRGTGWRGLCSLTSTDTLQRPLLSLRKAQLLEYAKQQNLQWYHDTTNDSTRYLRNYIRHQIISRLDHDQWYAYYLAQQDMRHEIDEEVKKIQSLRRQDYIMWPKSVAVEVLRSLLPITRIQACYALHAIKTAKIGKEIEVGGGYRLRFNRDSFVVIDPVP